MSSNSNIINTLTAEKIKKKQIDELRSFMQQINPTRAEENCVYCSLAVDTALRLGSTKEKNLQTVPVNRFPSEAFYEETMNLPGKRKANQKKKMPIRSILRSYVNHPEFNERLKICTAEDRVDLTDEDVEIIELDFDNKYSSEQKWIKLLRVHHTNLIEQLQDKAIPVRNGVDAATTAEEFLKEGVAFGLLFFAHKDLSDGHALNWVRFADGSLYFLDAQDPEDEATFIATTLPKNFEKYYAPHVFYICTTPPEGFKITVKKEMDADAKRALALEHIRIKQELAEENMSDEDFHETERATAGADLMEKTGASLAEKQAEQARKDAEILSRTAKQQTKKPLVAKQSLPDKQQIRALERIVKKEQRKEEERQRKEMERQKYEARHQKNIAVFQQYQERERQNKESALHEQQRKEEYKKELERYKQQELEKHLEAERIKREMLSRTPLAFQEKANYWQKDKFITLKTAPTYYFYCQRAGVFEYIAAKTHGLDRNKLASFEGVVEAFSSTGYRVIPFELIPEELKDKFNKAQSDEALVDAIFNTQNEGWFTGGTSNKPPMGVFQQQNSVHSNATLMFSAASRGNETGNSLPKPPVNAQVPMDLSEDGPEQNKSAKASAPEKTDSAAAGATPKEYPMETEAASLYPLNGKRKAFDAGDADESEKSQQDRIKRTKI